MTAMLAAQVKKPVRMASGISVVAVMSKPYPCPHGKCMYCPGGVDYGTPQSYYGREPALLRAIQCGYDPFLQVQARLRQYFSIGHKPSKVHLIVMGGTFPAMPLDYQEWFMTQCYEAMNRYPKPRRSGWVYLEEAQRRNEEAEIRCIGVTFETRPDWARKQQVDRMIWLGGTLVEVGVQTIHEDILARLERGHTVKDTVEATRILRDSGLKVGYHIMPGLPGSDLDRDLEVFKEIFENPDFKPDYLKIYPTLVIKGTKLYDMWLKGEYSPLSDEAAAELIAKARRYLPKWVRVSRIQRDVPADVIEAGVKKSNLREIVDAFARAREVKCRCIRCREVGRLYARGEDLSGLRPELTVEEYEAGGGVEVFLAFEDLKRDVLLGFLRLRYPSEKAHRREVKGAAVIRELHIYGPQVPVGEKWKDAWQHRGLGRRLVEKAEEITVERFGLKRITVLPGVGVRGYFRKLGFRKVRGSNFMEKPLG